MLFLACKLSSCRSVLVALARRDFADNSSSTHTTTTQLQLVSQGKDAVIGSSPVALVVLAQRGKKRSVQCRNPTSTVVLRGRRGTDGIGWGAWTGLGACDAAACCVAGVARTFTYCRFTWQAWHQLTSTVGLRGRRGTDGIGWRAWTGLGACDAAALCVAGVVLPACFFVLPACFFVPRASACLLLACLSTFFCRLSTCFGMFDFGMFKFGHLHAKTRSFWHVSSFRVLRHVCLWHV